MTLNYVKTPINKILKISGCVFNFCSSRSHSRNTSPQRSATSSRDISPRARSPVPELSDGNGSGERAAYGTRYKVAGGHSQRSPWSTCGSSSVADGLDDLCDELNNLGRIDRQGVSEFDDGSEGDIEQNQKLRVCIAGHFGVGKTALVSQFMSSEYMNTYEKSLGKYYQ